MILAVEEVVPVYELLGVSVEEGLRRIKEYLWDKLFKQFESRGGFERLWEGELKPLAEKALRDTYKVFYYLSLRDAAFVSNDASLIRGRSSGELEIAFLAVEFHYSNAGAVDPITVSSLRQAGDVVEEYFVAYARDKLEGILATYGWDAVWELTKLYSKVGTYPIVLAASARIEEVVENLSSWSLEAFKRANYGSLLFCFACRESTLDRWSQGMKRKFFLDVDRFKEILEAMGYKLEVVDVVEKNVVSILGKWRERRALGVVRNGYGLCLTFMEQDDEKRIRMYTYLAPCTALSQLVEDAKHRLRLWLTAPPPAELAEVNPLYPALAFQEVYLDTLSEFTNEERIEVAHEYLRMVLERRRIGRVELGRWSIFILDKNYVPVVKKPTMIILDKSTHKVYVVPLKFKGNLRDAEEFMERNRGFIERLYEQVLLKEDAPSELVELLTAIFLFEDIKH